MHLAKKRQLLSADATAAYVQAGSSNKPFKQWKLLLNAKRKAQLVSKKNAPQKQKNGMQWQCQSEDEKSIEAYRSVKESLGSVQWRKL